MSIPETRHGSPILIRTKLQRPWLRSDLIARPRLLGRLECSTDHKLTLVSAPAGYGKTTLLCQWLEDCPHPSAWLSLDENDIDWIGFVEYLVAAVRTAYPDACHAVSEVLQGPSAPRSQDLAAMLVNDLAELPGPLTLVLDDYHLIRIPHIHQFLAHVIRYLPPKVHLAIASRTDPPLALDHLRAGRQLVEVRERDLRFTTEETDAYVTLALGPEVVAGTSSLLAERTEGWIVGLHLATLWLRQADGTEESLAGLAGETPQFVSQYLASEVLAHQSAKVQRFLLQTSVLARFCAEMCDAVLEADAGSSAAVLADLNRANLFLIPLGGPGGWYRYHHLFQEMLQSELQTQCERDEIAAIHRRASAWCAENGHIENALQHALSAGDVDAALRLVEENAYGLLNRLERHTLERWLSLLPRDAVWKRPRLLVARAWLLYRQARLASLDAVLDAAVACLESGEDCARIVDEKPVWGQIHALRSATAYLVHEDFECCLASANRALMWLPTAEGGARSTALGFWALAQQALGEKDAAIYRLEQGLNDPDARGPAGIQIYLGLCLTHYLAGDLQQMLGVTRRFQALAAELKHSNAIVGLNWQSGLCHYELNDLAAGAQHFEQVFRLSNRSNFMAVFNSTIGLARIHQVRGELTKAQEIIDGLRAETLRLDNTAFLPSLGAFQAHQWLEQGDVAAALRWARAFNSSDMVESPFLFAVPSLTQARVLVAAGTDSEVRNAQRTLQDRLAAAKRRHFTQRAIQILAHLAAAHGRVGETEEGLASLEEALILAQSGGFVRSFVDAGPRLWALLLEMKQSAVDPHYLSEIMVAFDGLPYRDATLSLHRELVQLDGERDLLLTLREEQVLRLMRAGLTNKEIAKELVISVYTVKRHATNIYNKLEVRGRRQATRKAQRLGILSQD